MKFDVAIEVLANITWDWSEPGFAAIANQLGLEREQDADAELPHYSSPWGKEWVQAIIHDGAVERVEFLVEDTSPGRSGFSAAKLEALERKYRDKLAAYVKRATAVLGPPAFNAGYGATGFPEDEDANALALWRRGNARLMVMARNEGADTPFWLSIVVKPPLRAGTARPSRPVMRAPTRQSSVSLAAHLGARFDSAIKAISAIRWDWAAADLADKIATIGIPSTGDLTRVELVVESKSPGSDGFSEDELHELDREYFDKWDEYVARAQRLLGKPKFRDGMARKGYPKDEPAEFLALWQLKKARVMIAYRGDDAHRPFAIAIVVKP